jgi:hypothetical protein
MHYRRLGSLLCYLAKRSFSHRESTKDYWVLVCESRHISSDPDYVTLEKSRKFIGFPLTFTTYPCRHLSLRLFGAGMIDTALWQSSKCSLGLGSARS